MKLIQEVEIGDASTSRVRVGPGLPLAWIVGPCVIEDRNVMGGAAERLKNLSLKLLHHRKKYPNL